MYEIPGVLTFGQAYRLDQGRTEDHYEFVDAFSLTAGRHLVTLGGSVHHVNLDAKLANRFHGVYLFPTLADFYAGRPDVFFQAFGQPETRMSTTPAGLWLQDRWLLPRGLTVEMGLRHDRQFMPGELPPSSHNLAPRLGLAWRPGSQAPWVIRVGTGLFYDRYPLAFLNDAIQKDGSRAWKQWGRLDTAARSAYRASPDLPSTYAVKWTAGA
jgi:hypothetical protein